MTLPNDVLTSLNNVASKIKGAITSHNNSSSAHSSLFDKKLNTVDAQSEVVRFTNKDRINIERILSLIDNMNYYRQSNNVPGVLAFQNDVYQLKMYGMASGNTVYSDKMPCTNSDKLTLMCRVLKNNVEVNENSGYGSGLVTFKTIDGNIIATSLQGSITPDGETKKYFYNGNISLDPGIYYIYGEATLGGSLQRTNIFCVYVKDTTNKLGCNAWSGGEYNNNTSNTSTGAGQTIQITNEHSSIGESSFKIIRTGSASNWSEFPISQSVSSFTVTADIYSPVANGNMYALIKYTDGTQSFSNVSFQPNTSFQEVSVSTLSNGKTISFISLRLIVNHYDAPVYVDNLRIV